MTSMFFWIFLIKAVTLHSGTEDFPISRIGVFLSYLGTTPWIFSLLYTNFALRNQRRPPAKKLTLTISFARRSTQKSEISKAILMN